jgi:hypothetical protein
MSGREVGSWEREGVNVVRVWRETKYGVPHGSFRGFLPYLPPYFQCHIWVILADNFVQILRQIWSIWLFRGPKINDWVLA